MITNNYELSVWLRDIVFSTTPEKQERKLIVIGSDQMTSQYQAFNIQLKEKINGEITLNFSLHNNFFDESSNQKIVNPFISYLNNETYIKLYYENYWYDFIIKNINESAGDTYTYQCIDANILELTKNGYEKTFIKDSAKGWGSAGKLITETLKETDWVFDTDPDKSQTIIAKETETLVWLKMDLSNADKNIKIFKINDTEVDIGNLSLADVTDNFRETTTVIGAFYSSCTAQPDRFCFITKPTNANHYTVNPTNNVIEDKEIQYYATNLSYVYNSQLDLYLPTNWTVYNINPDIAQEDTFEPPASYVKANRYVYTPAAKYLDKFGKYANIYKHNLDTYYVVPEVFNFVPYQLPNLSANNSFLNTNGWTSLTKDFKLEISSSTDSQTATTENWLQGLGTKNETVTITNSGFIDNAKYIKNLSSTDTFWIRINGTQPSSIILKDIADSVDKNIIEFKKQENSTNWKGSFLPDVENIPTAEFTKHKLMLYFTFIVQTTGNEAASITIKSCEIYKEHQNDKGEVILPFADKNSIEQLMTPQVEHKYYYIKDTDYEKLDNTVLYFDLPYLHSLSNEWTIIYFGETQNIKHYAEATHSIEAEHSNYFNILNLIADTFNCYLKFVVYHDELGAITEKTVCVQNYNTQRNYAGFHYDVNIQNITRNRTSNTLVTKLFVQPNSNQFNPLGSCSISRARANQLGGNVIYNFDYLFETNILDVERYAKIVYSTEGVIDDEGKIISAASDNCINYALRSRQYNTIINQTTIDLTTQKNSLIDIKQKKAVLLDALNANKIQQQELYKQLQKLTNDSAFMDEPQKYQNIPDFNSLFKDYQSLQANVGVINTKLATINNLQNQTTQQINELQQLLEDSERSKKELDKCFYKLYSSVIQEGIWISEDYYDDNEYYQSAESVAYTSSRPTISYDIKVAAVECLPEYRDYSFKIGDITYVYDEDTFGTAKNGQINREQVLVTESVKYLDSPDKNTIVVQNYRKDDPDLFQKISAEVQQAHYSAGEYNKGAELIAAVGDLKRQFIDTGLSNAVELGINRNQTVKISEEGVTVTDALTPQSQLRLTGGAILLSGTNPATGITEWKTALTANGINADTINAGTINTSILRIMNETEPAFVWNKDGLTAYRKDSNKLIDKGVRFNKDGIYGFDNTKKQTSDGVEDTNIFRLGWDGLHVTAGSSTVNIGKDGDYLIHAFNNDTNTDLLTLDNTGVLKIKTSINVGGWELNENAIYKNSGAAEEDGTGMYSQNTNNVNKDGDNGYIRFYAGGPNLQSDITKTAALNNSKFYVTNTGYMKSSKGTIGGWEITNNTLKSTNQLIQLWSDNSNIQTFQNRPISICAGEKEGIMQTIADTTVKTQFPFNTHTFTSAATLYDETESCVQTLRFFQVGFSSKYGQNGECFNGEFKLKVIPPCGTDCLVSLAHPKVLNVTLNDHTNYQNERVTIYTINILKQKDQSDIIEITGYVVANGNTPVHGCCVTAVVESECTYRLNKTSNFKYFSVIVPPITKNKLILHPVYPPVEIDDTIHNCIGTNSIDISDQLSVQTIYYGDKSLATTRQTIVTNMELTKPIQALQIIPLQSIHDAEIVSVEIPSTIKKDITSVVLRKNTITNFTEMHILTNFNPNNSTQLIQSLSGQIARKEFIPNFVINTNGAIFATNANVQGTITSNKGIIGGIQINQTGLSTDAFALTHDKLSFTAEQAGIEFESFALFNDYDFGKIVAKDKLTIQTAGTNNSGQNTAIILNSGVGTDKQDLTIYVEHTIEEDNQKIKHLTLYFSVYTKDEIAYTPIIPININVSVVGHYWDGSTATAKTTLNIVNEVKTYAINFEPKNILGIPAYNIENYDLSLQLNNKTYDFGQISGELRKTPQYLAQLYTTELLAHSDIYIRGNLLPELTATYNLGSRTNKWHYIFSDNSTITQINTANGAITNSDAMVKNNVVPIPTNFDAFYDSLKPVNFTYSYGTSNRKHFGLIAQDIKKSLDDLKISTQDCAIYCEYPEPDAQGATCGIRYEELIPLNIWEIQELKRRITELEKQIENLTKPTNSDIIQVESKESKSEEIQ